MSHFSGTIRTGGNRSLKKTGLIEAQLFLPDASFKKAGDYLLLPQNQVNDCGEYTHN